MAWTSMPISRLRSSFIRMPEPSAPRWTTSLPSMLEQRPARGEDPLLAADEQPQIAAAGVVAVAEHADVQNGGHVPGEADDLVRGDGAGADQGPGVRASGQDPVRSPQHGAERVAVGHGADGGARALDGIGRTGRGDGAGLRERLGPLRGAVPDPHLNALLEKAGGQAGAHGAETENGHGAVGCAS